MNRKEVGEGFGRTSHCFKDREEELSFFRDLKKHERVQFLQPISDELIEANNGKHGLYRMDSGGRKGVGREFIGKNDYNWLKTPPATPLFPSLEMELERKGQQLVIQREIPIIQPLSRFAGISESKNKKTSSTPPNPNRHKTSTPTGRLNLASSLKKKKEAMMAQKTCTEPKKIQPKFPTSKAESRGLSPLVRPKIVGLSNDTPPNLRTTISPISTNQLGLSTPQKQETNPTIRRQSCSPRGRKGNSDNDGKKGQVVGSRMVERFMKARVSNMNETSKVSTGNKIVKMNESSGFGRLTSLDMQPLKHMDVKSFSSNIRQNGHGIGMVAGRKS